MTQTRHLTDEADIGSGEQEERNRQLENEGFNRKDREEIARTGGKKEQAGSETERKNNTQQDDSQQARQENILEHVLRTGLPPGVEEQDVKNGGTRPPDAGKVDNRS